MPVEFLCPAFFVANPFFTNYIDTEVYDVWCIYWLDLPPTQQLSPFSRFQSWCNTSSARIITCLVGYPYKPSFASVTWVGGRSNFLIFFGVSCLLGRSCCPYFPMLGFEDSGDLMNLSTFFGETEGDVSAEKKKYQKTCTKTPFVT